MGQETVESGKPFVKSTGLKENFHLHSYLHYLEPYYKHFIAVEIVNNMPQGHSLV